MGEHIEALQYCFNCLTMDYFEVLQLQNTIAHTHVREKSRRRANSRIDELCEKYELENSGTTYQFIALHNKIGELMESTNSQIEELLCT